MDSIKEIGILLFCFVAAVYWRGSKLTYPLMLCIVLIHEASHALATVLTGGRVSGITVYPNGSGVTISRGGNQIAILSSGYLGSLACGCLLYWLSYARRIDLVFAGLAFVLVIIALFWVATSFTRLFTVGLGLILVGLANFAPFNFQLIFLRFISACLIFYSLFDLHAVILASSVGKIPDCDLVKLSQTTKMPVWLWAFIWLMFASACKYLLIKFLIQ